MVRIHVLAWLASAVLAWPALAAIPEPIALDSGLVTGVPGEGSDVRVFKGIPFAAPPVDQRRWRPPEPPAPWSSVRDTSEFGPRCMQGKGTADPTVSEDCLYLNVWTAAASPAERRPVIIWSYGGSLRSGSGSQPQYDGEALARKGVVFITYNYRLGMFGFFSHPELTAESPHKASGNYGLMDLIAALEWIQRNVASFGGDPDNVTVMGESAGASLVSCLVTSPRAKGLFHRAIAQSTGCTGTSRIGTPLTTLAEAESQGRELAARLGAGSLAALRQMPADEILQRGEGTRVVVDGWNLVEDWMAALAAGRHNEVDLLVGSNKDEGTFPVFGVPQGTARDFVARSKEQFGPLASEFQSLYPAGSDSDSDASQLAAFRDLVFWNVRTWAHHHAKSGRAKAYVFYFTREPPTRPGQPSRGASHTVEIPYAFNNLRLDDDRPWTDHDHRLADVMSSYWVNFARSGDPNGEGLPQWPQYDSASPNAVMILGDEVAAGPGPSRAGLALYDRHYRSGVSADP